MATPLAWVLNLDADLELAAGAGYEPRQSVVDAMRAHVGALLHGPGALPGPLDAVVDASTAPGSLAGMRGRAFCPTPRALALLRRAGAEPEPHPPSAVLRRVNGRAFASELGPTLPRAAFVSDLARVEAMVRTDPELGDRWRLKRAFGMAGRGQRTVAPGPLGAADLAFVRGALAEGGLQVEPQVAIEDELAVHGVLEPSGACALGALVRQRCDPRGAWLATERIGAPTQATLGDFGERVVTEAHRVAVALFAAGYFGPFGVDAFTYRDRGGARWLQPRSEINARYSMGFAIGFGRGS